MYNAEAALSEMGVGEGPNGQFVLVVDRTTSALKNQARSYVIIAEIMCDNHRDHMRCKSRPQPGCTFVLHSARMR